MTPEETKEFIRDAARKLGIHEDDAGRLLRGAWEVSLVDFDPVTQALYVQELTAVARELGCQTDDEVADWLTRIEVASPTGERWTADLVRSFLRRDA
jgi:hypothetical protein